MHISHQGREPGGSLGVLCLSYQVQMASPPVNMTLRYNFRVLALFYWEPQQIILTAIFGIAHRAEN